MSSCKKGIFWLLTVVLLMGWAVSSFGFSSKEETPRVRRRIVTSDTLLASMVVSLLPMERYSVDAILPPEQCPGHYDVKLSDLEKIRKADLFISFKGMALFHEVGTEGKAKLILDSGGRNWMVPDAYVYGLEVLAEGLTNRFPEDREEIMRRKGEVVRMVREASISLKEKIKVAKAVGKAVLASSMQKEFLEWLGFRVIGSYGRPESISAKEILRLARLGRVEQVVAIVDNLQSGPRTGKGIADDLGVPHLILTNFPSEKGYVATLQENVETLLSAMRSR